MIKLRHPEPTEICAQRGAAAAVEGAAAAGGRRGGVRLTVEQGKLVSQVLTLKDPHFDFSRFKLHHGGRRRFFSLFSLRHSKRRENVQKRERNEDDEGSSYG